MPKAGETLNSQTEFGGGLLVCPACRSELAEGPARLVCKSAECRLEYEIRDGIPVMLVDEARELSVDEWNEVVDSLEAE